MKKLSATFFLLFILQGAGQVAGDLLKVVTFQEVGTKSAISSHDNINAMEGTDPTGMALSG